jgi:phosphoglycerate dehydrogenase-like enzyme
VSPRDDVQVLVTTTNVTEEALAIMADTGVRIATVPYTEPREDRLLRRAGRGSELAPAQLSAELRQALQEAEIIFSSDLPSDLPTLAPRLKWVQYQGAGIDQFGAGSGTGIWESDITITTIGGFNARAIAEFVLGLMLLRSRRFDGYLDAQARRMWQRLPGGSLEGQTVGVVGLGRIGTETARLCKGFGMQVVANRRRAAGVPPPNVDRIFDRGGLEEMLPLCDFVVLCAPMTPETHRMFGKREFGLMKPTSMFINVARGPLVDEDALVEALRDGSIGGAGLDVFDEEPLSAENRLWEVPNLIVTPHASAAITGYPLQAATEFAENLRRYVAGEPLMNIVDRSRGY